ncbi:MAG: arginine--tRNA ligase [Candidatus Gracilibacteria bacterium]|nr:arginine--tRNA ligase [Candidatus Gracilibacteria bacterium]
MEKALKQDILKLIKENYSIELYDINLTIPPKKEMGDFAFNCGILSRELKKNPNLIASEILPLLKTISEITDVSSEGAFVNIKVSKDIFTKKFFELYNLDFSSQFSYIGNGKKIIVDYIGANVGKPLHIGHMCTPNIGQAMINIYKKFGYDVISDSHIGDWGIIFGKLITAYKLWGDENKLKENAVDYLLELYVKITSEIENDSDLEQKTRDEFKLLSEGNPESIELWSKFTKYSIEAMNKNLARLNVKPDYNIGESFYEGLGLPKMEDFPDLVFDMHSIVVELISKGIATQNEDGSVGVIFENDKLPSCILQKRDGTHGYLASDLACIKYRTSNWTPEKIVYFVDVRQQLHFKQAFEIAKNAGWLIPHSVSPKGREVATELFHAFNGFISGKEGAFSTRKGNIIKLGDLLDEAEIRAKKIILEKRDDLDKKELNELSKIIGIGAIKYGHLKKSRETDMIFDWDEFMTFEGNSGPYIQYAYVRALRIIENFGENFDMKVNSIFESLEEIELVKQLGSYREVLVDTFNKNMPHILCKYAYDLTKTFNSFYNAVHILNEDDFEKKILRLKMVKLFTITLKDAFSILGIEMPNKM